MKNNNKGFTLIEILAVIIIIAVGGTIAIVAVSQNILKSRDATVVDLAKTYMESARTMKAKDAVLYEPKTNEAVVLPCSQINGTEIEHKNSTGYGNVLPDYCYVGIVYEGNEKFGYYMTLADDTYHMIINSNYNRVTEDDILVGSGNLSSVSAVKTPLTSFAATYGADRYTIRAVRMKYNATYNDGAVKTATIYGYYTNDGTQSSTNAQIKGTISELDTFMASTNKVKNINGVNYTITDSEIMYIIVKK